MKNNEGEKAIDGVNQYPDDGEVKDKMLILLRGEFLSDYSTFKKFVC
jgi:hypothetical protein